MTRTHLASVVMLALVATVARGQETARVAVAPDSKLWIEGTSNLHGWSCKATTLEAHIELDATAAAQVAVAPPKALKRVQVKVPVKSLKCGHGGMDGFGDDAVDAALQRLGGPVQRAGGLQHPGAPPGDRR